MLKAYDRKTGEEVKEGDTITDFRGDKAIFAGATRATGPSKDGKVCFKTNGFNFPCECYAKVFGLVVKEAEEASRALTVCPFVLYFIAGFDLAARAEEEKK